MSMFLGLKTMAATTGLAALMIGGVGLGSNVSADVAPTDVAAQTVEVSRRGGGNGEGRGNTALAEALGVTVDELQAAKEAARDAAVDQLIADGWITEDDAENGVRGFRGPYYEPIVDEDALMADALGITVSELEAAKESVQEARIEAALESGRITEDDIADRDAVQAFKESIDSDAVLAEALGISEADLDAARADNVTFDELVESLDLTNQDVREAVQTITSELVDDAVESGDLTQEQADSLENRGNRNGRGGNGNGPRGGNGNGDAPAGEDAIDA